MKTEEAVRAAETKEKAEIQESTVEKPWKRFARYNGASAWSRFWEDFRAAFSPRFKRSRELAGKQLDFHRTCDAMWEELRALMDPATTGERLLDATRNLQGILEPDTAVRGETLGKRLGLAGVASRTIDQILDSMETAIRTNQNPETRARLIRALNPIDNPRCLDILRAQAAAGKTDDEKASALLTLSGNPDLKSAAIAKEILAGGGSPALRKAAAQFIAAFAGHVKAQVSENPKIAPSLAAFAESVLQIPSATGSSTFSMDGEPLLEAKLSLIKTLFDMNLERHRKRFRLREERPGLDPLTRALSDARQPSRVHETIVELATRSTRYLEQGIGMPADVTAFLTAAVAKGSEIGRLREATRIAPSWVGLEPEGATMLQDELRRLKALVDRSTTLTANLRQIPESPMQYRELTDKKSKSGGCTEIFRGAPGARGHLEHYYFQDSNRRWYWLELAGPRTKEEDQQAFEILNLPYPKPEEDVKAALARVRRDRSEIVGEPDGRVFGIRSNPQ